MRFSILALAALAAFASPTFAQCPSTGCFQSYGVQQQFYAPQAVVVPSALFVVPSAPTVQLNVQYGYAQPFVQKQVLVQPVVQKQVIQKVQVQKVQQVKIQQVKQPSVQRFRSVTRTRLFNR